MAEGVGEAPSSTNSSIVEDWLRSVDLVQYTQAFLDNGYDDLEVCKQIGEDDLKAIGVLKDEHTERLLRAVKVLKEDGGTAVYFTLEECDTCQSGDETEVGEADDRSVHSFSRKLSTPVNSGANGRHMMPPHTAHGHPVVPAMMHGFSRRKPLTTFTSVQLQLILRDKLVLDNIDLSNPPYTNMDQCMCGSSVTALALRFSQELNTHFAHVLEQLEDLWIMANNEAINYPDMCRSPSRAGGMYTRSHSVQYDPHLHPGYRHMQPPPLPTCPPPATMSSSHVGRSMQAHLDQGHVMRSADPLAQPNYVAIDGGVCCLFPRKIVTDPLFGAEEKKKGSVFGRFLRNFGLRRSARKASYKQHHGDLNAYEMSMSEEDRMALMLLVKEGKISTQTALEVVQKYEEEKRLSGGVGGSSMGIGALALEVAGKENLETPSKKLGKKKKGNKPPKSQSSLSADDPHHVGIHHHSPPSEISSPQGPCEHLVCRRVHSLGQLDSGHQPMPLDMHHHHHDPHRDKMMLTRAVSCSPACTPSHKLMGPSADGRLNSPGHHHFPHAHLHSHAQQNLFQHSYQPHPQQQQLQQQHQQHHLQQQHQQQQQQQQQHSHQHMNKMDSLRERLSVRATINMPKTSSKTSLLSSGSDQSMDCLSHPPPLRTDQFIRRGGNEGSTYASNSTVSMSSENSPALSRKKNGMLPEPKLKNQRSASCSTGDDGISSENDDPEQRSRSRLKQEIAKGKTTKEHRRHPHQVKEAHIYRPPLLRQQSAPGNGAAERYLGQAKAVVDFTPGPDQDGFVSLKKGEIVNILNMAQSGVWRGVVNGRQGKFRFEHVEVIIDPDSQSLSPLSPHPGGGLRLREMPQSVADMLSRIGLESLTNLFMTNGYDDLDIFSELDENDLDTLHIGDPIQRTKLLSAVKVLADWNEKLRSHTPSITAVDSPSSRAGNSSCDSGCYVTGEGGSKHKHRLDGKKGERSRVGHHPSCTSCGKPKQAGKQSAAGTPVGGGPPPPTPPPPSSYPSAPSAYTHQVPTSPYSPYAPGYHGTPYLAASSNHYNPSTGYQWDGHDSYRGSMTNSSTLTEMNVTDSNAMMPQPAGHPPGVMYPGGPGVYRERYLPADGHTLTEEDQEVIAITYGTHRRRKLSTPVQPISASSSHSEIASGIGGSGNYAPSYYYRQYDGVSLCSDPSCAQCVAYMSCPQCATYHHYVNTTIRSDSKSSKMSYGSNCTQTTCLSPDQEENNYGSCHSDCPTSPNRLASHSHHGGYLPHTSHTLHTSHPSHSSHSNVYPLSPSYGQMAPGHHSKFMSSQLSMESAARPFSPGQHQNQQAVTPGDESKQQQNKGTNDSAAQPPQQSSTSVGQPAQGPTANSAMLKSEGNANTPKTPLSTWPYRSDIAESQSIASLYSREGGAGIRSPSATDTAGVSSGMKSPMRSLMPLVSTKLSAERIDLAHVPYTNETGECHIPPLLVQRYAEELRQDLKTISSVLEQIRAKSLHDNNQQYVKNEKLSDTCSIAVELQISSVPAFLVSIGLPMYESILAEAKMTTVEQLIQLKATELEKVTGADSRHLQRITHALEWVQSKLSSPTHKAKTTGPVDKV